MSKKSDFKIKTTEEIKFSNTYSIIFLLLFFAPSILFYAFPLRGTKDLSILENRPLQQVPKFSWQAFFDKQFQDELENSIIDQMVFGQSLKKIINQSNQIIHSITKDAIQSDDKCNLYVGISETYYFYGCDEYMVEKKIDYKSEKNKIQLEKNAESFNTVIPKNVKKYIYFIEKDRTIDFTKQDFSKTYIDEIVSNYSYNKYSYFAINNFANLKKYFYQTDHHWNYEGSYKGYQETVKLILGDKENTLKPVETKTFNIDFIGASARRAGYFEISEPFTVYRFNTPKYEIYINNKRVEEYGSQDIYFNNKYSNQAALNHYAEFYGKDYGLVVYKSNQPLKDNLLVLSTSYTAAIKDLLSSHFNETHYYDPRNYKGEVDINQYIIDNKIDNVLLIGDIYSFIVEDFYLGGEK